MNWKTLQIRFAFISATALILAVSNGLADDASVPTPQASQRHLLIACGLPGDDGHRERLDGACRKLVESAESVLGVSPERMTLLVGDEGMQAALSATTSVPVSVCTRESLQAALTSLGEQATVNDECWVILLGHAHLDEGRSQFNVLGSDLDQEQFAAWTKPLTCNRQVFWLTMPVSGYWIKPLSSPARCVVTATEAGLEFTGTEMPYALADLVAGDGEKESLRDVDGDGSLSLLDLYLAVNLEIHARFKSLERLQTEHAQLDDNGDGRGSEVQARYLPDPLTENDNSDSTDTESNDTESNDTESNDTDNTDNTDTSTASPTAGEDARQRDALPAVIVNESLDGFRSRHVLLPSPSPPTQSP